ncbi:MAG: FAD:protein FMN transferase [Eggerthellaceae bacterium]|nr:FAD:protein FMN transferase [Eggerthellaceae bacterium]
MDECDDMLFGEGTLAGRAADAVPRAEAYEVAGPDGAGLMSASFLAFNTHIALSAYGEPAACRRAFAAARDACRVYERLFSRTLPHSDIARLNAAGGKRVAIDPRTHDLLERALHYCTESEGAFDVTVGPLVRLWDFRRGVVPAREALEEATQHVDWRALELGKEADATCWACLRDPLASVDAGGIAKGWIADALTLLLDGFGFGGFIVNLGGNVVVRGAKPGGSPWRVGVRNPRNPSHLVGAVPLSSGSAVTSGIYERGFTRDGVRYHHILDPRTGMPVHTDATGVTVVADKSIDAEGFSTTLFALGVARGSALVRRRPEITQAFFVGEDERVTAVY